MQSRALDLGCHTATRRSGRVNEASLRLEGAQKERVASLAREGHRIGLQRGSTGRVATQRLKSRSGGGDPREDRA
jgi:hypothetical protein